MNGKPVKDLQTKFSLPFWIAVAALLSAAGIVAALAQLPRRTHCPVERIDLDTANILTAINFYRSTFGEVPVSNPSAIARAIRGKEGHATVFLDWQDRMISPRGELLDPWGTAYKFYRAGDEIIIRSAGPNRQFNNSAESGFDDYFR